MHFEADLGYGIYLERIASHDVDRLVFLVPAHDAWILGGIERQIRPVGSRPDYHAALPIGERQMHLSAISHGGESLPNFGLAASLFSEGLRTRDVGEFAIAVLTWNTGGIFCVKKPVNMPECTGLLIAGLRDEGDVAHLRQTGRLALLRPDRVDLMEGDEHIGAP